MKDDDHLFSFDRKESKRDRKIAKKTDRSQYKKTDFEKKEVQKQIKLQKKISAQNNLLRGRVLSVKPEVIVVATDSNQYSCTLKGSLKKEIGIARNIVAVGDFVYFDPQSFSICAIEERKSFLSKRFLFNEKKEQYVACNIDFVLIIASCVMPPLNPSLIDRYIIATRKGNMTPVIVVNKIDLLDNDSDEKLLYEEAFAVYANLGFKILGVSAKTLEGIETLKEIMKDHSSVFAGESGVGKSSLINLITGLNLRTKDVTDKTWRGTHTTTGAELIPLSFGGFCIDTPGIQKFSIWDLQREDLDLYFPEFSHLKTECKYPDCSHTHEPGCALQKALEKKQISAFRYKSYTSLVTSLHKDCKNHS